MSYTRTIINGSTVSKEGGSSFDEELADLQDQIDGIGSGSVPTGTGLRHVTSGVEDGTAYVLTNADMPFTGTPTGSKFLRDDQSWQNVSANNNAGQITRIARVTSDQTGVSGSFVADYIDFNSVVSSDGSHWVRTSAGLYTCDTAGEWIIILHTYNLSSPYIDLVQNGTAREELHGPLDNNYNNRTWRLTTAANDTIRFKISASATNTIAYSDGTRHDKVNFIEIIRIK